MKDGAMIKLLRALKARSYLSHSEAMTIARSDRYYKEGTIERRLRKDSRIQNQEIREALNCVEVDEPDGYIKGYRWICPPKIKVEVSSEERTRELAQLGIF